MKAAPTNSVLPITGLKLAPGYSRQATGFDHMDSDWLDEGKRPLLKLWRKHPRLAYPISDQLRGLGCSAVPFA